jgi:hypothetical protein
MEWISGTIQFVYLALGKTFILSKVLPWEHSCGQNSNNKHINSVYSVSPLEQWAGGFEYFVILSKQLLHKI